MSTAWQVVVAATAACVLVQGVLLIGLLAKGTSVLSQMQAVLATVNLSEAFRGLDVGDEAPPPPPHKLLAGHVPDNLAGSLVLFATDDCDPCKSLLQDLRSFDVPGSVGAVLVVPDETAYNPPALPGWSVVEEHHGAWTRAFRISAVPYAYAVGSDGRIADRGIPGSADDLERLAAQLTHATEIDSYPESRSDGLEWQDA
jgi:hypothetical protein